MMSGMGTFFVTVSSPSQMTAMQPLGALGAGCRTGAPFCSTLGVKFSAQTGTASMANTSTRAIALIIFFIILTSLCVILKPDRKSGWGAEGKRIVR